MKVQVCVACQAGCRESINESKLHIVGTTIEYHFFRGFAVEGDFLYRHAGSCSMLIIGRVFNSATMARCSHLRVARFDSFELPVLRKYYFRHDSKVQPFLPTGYTFRKALADNDSKYSVQNNNTGNTSIVKSSTSTWTALDMGASFGTSVRWPDCVAPEICCTRWCSHPNIGFRIIEPNRCSVQWPLSAASIPNRRLLSTRKRT
jgi:hypothetical protein